jgi:predicted permease
LNSRTGYVGLHVTQTVAALFLVVLIAVILKRRGIVRDEHSEVFAKIVTQAILPIVIFRQLSTYPVSGGNFILPLIMVSTSFTSLAVAWLAGRLLRLDRATIGAIMIASSFDSTAMIGYPLIAYVFPHDPVALTDAILLSELGVGLPIFTICPIVAMHFGEPHNGLGTRRKIFIDYLKSPIFASVVLGLLVSQMRLHVHNLFIAPFYEALRMVDGGLILFACVIVAIQLKFDSIRSIRDILPLVTVCMGITMVMAPWLAYVQATLLRLSTMEVQIIVLISSLPSAMLGPVFATRFKCRGDIVAAMAVISMLISVLVVPLTFDLLHL